jgi:hypothetical protein
MTSAVRISCHHSPFGEAVCRFIGTAKQRNYDTLTMTLYAPFFFWLLLQPAEEEWSLLFLTLLSQEKEDSITNVKIWCHVNSIALLLLKATLVASTCCNKARFPLQRS